MPFAVLLATLRTAVGFWDTGDLQTVAWIAGIPYPTGYPGFVAIGWVWSHIVPIGSVAARVNALSALAIAGAAGTIAALALLFRVLPLLAVLAAWSFAFAHVVWLRGTYVDAHPVGFAIALVAIALGVRWSLRGEPRALAAAIVLSGVAVAVDNTTLLLLAGGAVAASARRWPLRLTGGALAIGAVIVLLAYAYLPLRSAYVSTHRLDPTLALGVPPGRPFWDDHHPADPGGFRALVLGTEWSAGSSLAGAFSPSAIRLAYDRFHDELGDDEPQGLIVAALIGLGFVAADAPLIALGLFLAAVIPALFGAAYPAEADPERYVFMLYAAVALGVAIAADRAVRAFGAPASTVPLAVACVLLAAVVARDVVRAGDILAQRNDTGAQELVQRVAASTRDDAIVVAPWDFATPLAYGAYVEGALGGRIVLCALPRDHLREYAVWSRTREVAIVSHGDPDLPGYRTRRLSEGDPQVYEILAP